MKNSVNSVSYQSETNSSLSPAVPVYPLPPYPEQSFGKTAAFLAGVIVGAVGLAAAAYFAEESETAHCSDSQPFSKEVLND